MKVYTQTEFDRAKCEHGCAGHPVEVLQPCHPEAGQMLTYDPESGTIQLSCALCKMLGPKILVAERQALG